MLRTKKMNAERAIKEAIDSYPGGLCFASAGGKPIMVNQQMNQLVEILTGRTLMDANITWDELAAIREQNGCTRLERPWMQATHFSEESSLLFRYPDGKIWQFRKQTLIHQNTQTVQLEAMDITALYEISEELYQNNRRLLEMSRRQEVLLSNIVQINQNRELLAAKIRIHDDYGRCLAASGKALDAEGISDDAYSELFGGWREAISDMKTLSVQNKAASPETELRKVADLVGCSLHITGEQPSERRSLLLLYSVLREALTNAVRHAGATGLNVEISKENQLYHAVITSNGNPPDGEITESGGLKSLRQSLEQEGAALYYQYGESFAVVADIPLMK